MISEKDYCGLKGDICDARAASQDVLCQVGIVVAGIATAMQSVMWIVFGVFLAAIAFYGSRRWRKIGRDWRDTGKAEGAQP